MVFQLLFFEQPLLLIVLLIVALTILYYYRSIFYGIRNSIVYKSLTKKDEEPVKKERKSLECPMCSSTNMQQGYLVSSSQIFWSNRNTVYPFFSRNPLPFPARVPSFGQLTPIEAYRCKSCGIIYLDTKQGQIPEAG